MSSTSHRRDRTWTSSPPLGILSGRTGVVMEPLQPPVVNPCLLSEHTSAPHSCTACTTRSSLRPHAISTAPTVTCCRIALPRRCPAERCSVKFFNPELVVDDERWLPYKVFLGFWHPYRHNPVSP